MSLWYLPYIEDLHNTVLRDEHLGTQILDTYGILRYSHVAWAVEIDSIIDILGDSDRGHYLPVVRRQIPLIVQRLLPGNLTTWQSFLFAISALSHLEFVPGYLENRMLNDRLHAEALSTLSKIVEHRDAHETARHPVCQFYRKPPPYKPAHPAPTPTHSPLLQQPIPSLPLPVPAPQESLTPSETHTPFHNTTSKTQQPLPDTYCPITGRV